MYLTPTENHWAADIEADGLLDEATKIWCVTLENVLTGETFSTTTADSFLEFLEGHPDALFVGHNFLAYDTVMLNRFWKAGIGVKRVVDTFVLSQVYNPSYPKPPGLTGKKGPHSLEAWGIRLKFPKGDFTDFSAFSDEMLKYCANDTSLTRKLFLKLSERMRQVGFTETGLEIEHLAWNIIQNKQRRNGFPFNKQKAEMLYATLRHREEELQREIYKLWPPKLEVVATYRGAIKKDGSRSAQYLRHREQFPKVVETGGGCYDAYDWVAFNLGSPPQRIEKLLELGWKPVSFTKKTKKGGGGNPKVDEDSLVAFAETSGKKELLALSKWVVINSRANMINTWLEAYDEKTGCIHGKLFIASTLRYKHNSPNSANIPAVRLKKNDDGTESIQYGEDGFWTYESRDLFDCGNPDEWSLVGIDGTGIQTRCLIHHLIKTIGEEGVREFKEIALAGDIHKRNIELLGVANKAAAKKAFYTMMMGGGGGRIAADQLQFGTKLTSKEGEVLKSKMIAGMPGFGKLIENLEKDLERSGRITLCDGTPIIVPSPHMVIPYLLQGDESRLMKKAKILVDEVIRRKKWTKDILWAADIHDEWQVRVRKGLEEEFIAEALPCFNRAGEFFNYNISVDGDAVVGKTWAGTH